jgi:hypothetical protein
MKSTRLLASLAAVLLVDWAAACSPKDADGGSPDGSANGASGGQGGSNTGGSSGSSGGSTAAGGSSGQSAAGSGGTQDGSAGDGGTDGSGNAGTNGASGTPDGGAGDSGTQGSAGTTGSAGAAGNAGTQGAAGTAGSAGSQGSAGTAGVDGGGTGGTGPGCQANFQTDPEHCGRCNHSCGGGDCRSGRCEPVVVLNTQRTVPNEVTPREPTNEVLVTQGTLYYWNKGYPSGGNYTYDIVSASVVPTNPPASGTVLQSFPLDPTALIKAVHFNGGYFYYTMPTGVFRKKLDTSDGTGAGTRVFTLDTGRIWGNLAIAGGKAYVAGEVDTIMIDQIRTAIYSIALPVANAATKPTLISGLDALPDRVSDLAVVNGNIFWLQYDRVSSHHWLWTAPVAGGTPRQLDDVGNAIGSTIVGDADGTYVYWNTGSSGGKVRRCRIADLATFPVQDLAAVNNAHEGLPLDANYVYFMESTGRSIYRVAKNGGGRELLASTNGSQLVAVDDRFVYFTDFDGLVHRLSKEP